MLPFRVIVAPNPRSSVSRQLTEYFLQAKSSPLSSQTSAVRPLPVLPPPTPSPKFFICNTYEPPASFANKRLTALVTPLNATLTKNTGRGLPEQLASHSVPPCLRGYPVFHLPYALPSSVSRNSCICHSLVPSVCEGYENTGGVYQQFPFWFIHSDACDGDFPVFPFTVSTFQIRRRVNARP